FPTRRSSDNLNYVENQTITFNVKYIISVNYELQTRDIKFQSLTYKMEDWYKIIYSDYCSETSLDIMLYIKEKFTNLKIELNDKLLLSNSSAKGNYEIVEYLINNYLDHSEVIIDSLEQVAKNYVKTENYIKTADLLIKIINNLN